MKVLITGGAGFIGATVSRNLRDRGVNVRVLDVTAGDLEGVQYYVGSVLDKYAVNEAVRGCDAVIHLAAMLGVRKTESLRLHCLNINIEGSVNVFDACVMNNVGKVLLSSSSEVYGESNTDKIDETWPLSPKSVYAVSKLAAEQYLLGYALRYGFQHTIVRFFNVYGSGQIAEFVVPRFVSMALNNQPLTVYGEGSQIRSFCHVDDAANGVERALFSDKSAGEVFNIGNDREPITIMELATLVAEISDRKVPINKIPMSGADRNSSREIYMRRPNVAKAASILGFEPTVPLKDGIKRMFENGNIKTSWFEPLQAPKVQPELS